MLASMIRKSNPNSHVLVGRVGHFVENVISSGRVLSVPAAPEPNRWIAVLKLMFYEKQVHILCHISVLFVFK